MSKKSAKNEMNMAFKLSVICLAVLGNSAFGQGHRYALLVGVDKYPSSGNFRTLDFPARDVDEFASVLIKSGFEPENVITMTLERGAKDPRYLPNAAQINQEIDAILEILQEQDTLILGFSGHGLLLPVEREENGQTVQKQESFFCPIDADSSAKDLRRFVALDELYRRLDKKTAAIKLLVVDACRAEPLIHEKAGPKIQLAPPSYSNTVMALYSCKPKQISLDDEGLQNGVFFHFLIEGCRGNADSDRDRNVTLLELANYVTDEVPTYVRNRYGQVQIPVVLANSLERISLLSVSRAMPEPLTAPFTAKIASDSQTAWTDYLGTETVDAAKPTKLDMEMVLIPPGQFEMGSPTSETDRDDDEVSHTVRITRPFLLGIHEVTQAEYKAVVGENPSYFSAGGDGSSAVQDQKTDRFPVESVSWLDAVKFCNALSKREGKRLVYSIQGENGSQTTVDEDANGYRLPTEAEWEYACRAGTTSPFHFGKTLNGREANVDGNYPYGTSTKGPYLDRSTRVGSFGANGFGLYDMHGNVWEWCWDWYGDYDRGSKRDPDGAEVGSGRVNRGGSWSSFPRYCRSAYRGWNDPSSRFSVLGFRVASSPFGQAK